MDTIKFNCDLDNSDKIVFYVDEDLLIVKSINEDIDVRMLIGLTSKDAIKLANYILENVNDE